MAKRLRTKQILTFQETSQKLPVGILTVGESITQEQFDQIKDNPRFCEVLEPEKEDPKKEDPKKAKAKSDPEPVKKPSDS